MKKKKVEWSRPDLKPHLVYLLQDGHSKPYQELNPLYRERTALSPDTLTDGYMVVSEAVQGEALT